MALQLFKIASVVVETPQASIDFTSIPSGYTDLYVVFSTHLTGTSFGETTVNLTFNSSSSSYSWRSVFTDSTSSYSQNGSGVAFIQAGIMPASQLSVTTNVYGTIGMYIPSYTSSNYKSVSIDYNEERNSLDNYIGLVAGLWSNTSAITSLSLTPNSSNFSSNSTATLYGVL